MHSVSQPFICDAAPERPALHPSDAEYVVQQSFVRTTITIRASSELREAVKSHAASLGKSLSEFVRDTLEEAVSERSVGARAAHVAGRLGPAEWQDAWHRELRERNWRT